MGNNIFTGGVPTLATTRKDAIALAGHENAKRSYEAMIDKNFNDLLEKVNALAKNSRTSFRFMTSTQYPEDIDALGKKFKEAGFSFESTPHHKVGKELEETYTVGIYWYPN